MTKDQRYEKARRLINSRRIKTLDQLFAIIPKSTVAGDIHISFNKMETKLNNTEKFRLADLFTLAMLVGVPNIEILALAAAQYEANHAIK